MTFLGMETVTRREQLDWTSVLPKDNGGGPDGDVHEGKYASTRILISPEENGIFIEEELRKWLAISELYMESRLCMSY